MIKRNQHCGFVIADVIVGMMVVAILAAALASANYRQQQSARRLADTRAATRLAEQVITSLQTGTEKPSEKPGQSITIRSLEAAADIRGCKWIAVDVTHNGRRATLMGIVPTESATAAAEGASP